MKCYTFLCEKNDKNICMYDINYDYAFPHTLRLKYPGACNLRKAFNRLKSRLDKKALEELKKIRKELK